MFESMMAVAYFPSEHTPIIYHNFRLVGKACYTTNGEDGG